MDLIKAAAAIEAAADHLEAVDAEKRAQVGAERQSSIDKLAGKYTDATGEEMPDAIRKKLAESDSDVVGLLQSMVDKQASQLETLGSPSTIDDEKVPTTKKEAAENADSRFLNWVQS
jgi:hypothetical protein